MKKVIWLASLVVLLLLQGPARAQSSRSDVLVAFDPVSALVDLDLGGAESELDLVAGSNILIQSDDVTCVNIGCVAQLMYLRATFQNFTSTIILDGSNVGQVSFENPTVVVTGPIPMVRGPLGFVVQEGVTVSFSGTMSGVLNGTTIPSQLASGIGHTTADMLIGLSVFPLQVLTLDAIFPFTLSGTGLVDGEAVDINLSGSVGIQASGLTPFANVPPRAIANAPAVVSCGEEIELDATDSVDADDDISEFRWLASDGTLLATGETAVVELPTGTHTITLEVQDSFGAIGRDTVTVQVSPGPPEFTFVPPDVVAYSCGALSLGQALASSECGGEAVVTNDAPSFFYAGITQVIWTATAGGQVTTEAQQVLVYPNDNVACCPPGINVIVGTSNNDVLTGTPGRDCILGRNAQDVINGGGGDDIISGGEGDDQISGGSGNDVISSGNGQDNVSGNDGNDSLLGSGGDDLLFGGNGDDLLDGGDHNDQCTGGAGVDQFLSCTVQDQLDGPPQPPPGGGSDDFDVCLCRPQKCNDCTGGVQTCEATPGCASIIECVSNTAGCNLPHECSATCEGNQTAAAINAARNLASCFGGC